MNGVCAGGTGAFIDQMAALLDTDAKGLNDLAAKAKRIYTIASRCGVFAKTDIQALMNDGASREDIARSVFQAVVNQTIGNLAQGREIKGNVAFLGGPLTFLPELKKRFIETLEMKPENVVEVADGAYFVAIGCALSQETKVLDYAALVKNLDKAQGSYGIARDERLALFHNDEEYQEFLARHAKDKVKRGELAAYRGPIYLGIDAGSTTTKIVAIGRDKEILYTDYGSNQGAPWMSSSAKCAASTGPCRREPMWQVPCPRGMAKISSRRPSTPMPAKWKPSPTTALPGSFVPRSRVSWTSAART